MKPANFPARKVRRQMEAENRQAEHDEWKRQDRIDTLVQMKRDRIELSKEEKQELKQLKNQKILIPHEEDDIAHACNVARSIRTKKNRASARL